MGWFHRFRDKKRATLVIFGKSLYLYNVLSDVYQPSHKVKVTFKGTSRFIMGSNRPIVCDMCREM